MIASQSPLIDCRSVLVLGGARSGKSAYAQRLAEAASAQRVYLATGSAGDAEMAERIRKHQSDRADGWATQEAPVALAGALEGFADKGRVILVDCLTFWLANCLFAGLDPAGEIAALCRTIRALKGPVVFVSNEVGSGVVPQTRLGRDFRDWQGRANQDVASACDAVVLVTAGLPALLKPANSPRLGLA